MVFCMFCLCGLLLLVGQYAHNYFLGEKRKETLTLTVKSWRDYYPEFFVLPHPSPRNNIWLKKNPWFGEIPPVLKGRVWEILGMCG